MLFLPKVKKDDPCLKATKKVKSLVASLLAAVAVAVSGAAYGERQKFCVHGIIGARQTGASNEHEHQTQFS